MAVQKYRGVIFDLWGTLVDEVFLRDHERIIERFARAIGLDGQRLEQMWQAAGCPRDQDGLPHIEKTCELAGYRPNERQSRAVIDCRRDIVFYALTPREHTKEIFTRLRGRNVMLGMIVNCSSNLPNLWCEYPFSRWLDIAVFSCTIGCGKPNPLIYKAALERLALPANKALYVGDGDQDELDGARAAGLDAALICVASERQQVMSRPQGRNWTGPVVDSLDAVPDLVLDIAGESDAA